MEGNTYDTHGRKNKGEEKQREGKVKGRKRNGVEK